MSISEKREYLSKYRIQYTKICRMRQMIEEFPESAEKYKKIINEAIILRDKMECEIDNIDGGLLSEILSQKYICGKSIEEIAYNMNYSKRQMERLHLKALDALTVT